ncbi:Phosphoenolpyruvate carboxykinase (ATP) 2 [Aduncisulcus paluster]|uniref:phosphoenolpyruvate carboxykinase (ATP) n=1 Tax=Aduncisulcus paluster TaxID=2918883 RepID=A0ABQ5KSE7_9EUKA|nr:Phosphoenolpyruvate carboxykinase (ATP) 2 [Aduncisulcus paluster]|eukprot:gnl/Carplike_NY0171/331_a456_2709.p1 GENE.gnl/Carplike_NY0171/331_a456_2709~~gnl/Carplike_NY0171/331_a456_2709.p1  ORF type:complete len:558 (-),score=195.72 gnl/Carplike_NY0171/331_a456_2709:94-1767(-)
MPLDLAAYGIKNLETKTIFHNAPAAVLYEQAILHEGAKVSDMGALVAYSGKYCGRSPKDKRIVYSEGSKDDVWWLPEGAHLRDTKGSVSPNQPISEEGFAANKKIAIEFLSSCDRLYVTDGIIGWEEKCWRKVRIISSLAYHAIFMKNMMKRITEEEKEAFVPDFLMYNAGAQTADQSVESVCNDASVNLSLDTKEQVVLGSMYAGEQKKGLLTYAMYYLPKEYNFLPMHCSCTEDPTTKKCTIFFGLSGTGKTTLSADPRRELIGDDEHIWHDTGVCCIEGGAYAKVIDLDAEKEPDIYKAIRFGSILENVKFIKDKKGEDTRTVDWHDTSITLNTRSSFPIEHMDRLAKIPCCTTPGSHPEHVVFLTYDAFGVLPPVSRLNRQQQQYYFALGFTSKVAGTEVGITEPKATFSPCFGGPFLIWHPSVYAKLLADLVEKHGSNVWLINTGFVQGAYGEGHRIHLKHTRSIVDAIHDGSLVESMKKEGGSIHDKFFGLEIPTAVKNVPSELLIPRNSWKSQEAYDAKATQLCELFKKGFKQYEGVFPDVVIAKGGPQI